MCKFLAKNFFLVILLLPLSGFSTVQVLAKENSISGSISSQTSDLCRTLSKGLSKLQLTEKDRVSRIEQALVEIESGHCYYCLNLVARLLKKDDLKEGSRFKERIDGMTRQRVGCTTLLLPSLISDFDYKVPVGNVDDFSKLKRYDLSKVNIYQVGELDWKKELISATLFSNNNPDVASKYVVDILSQFDKSETLIEHCELLRSVIKCNPIDEDIISIILSQSIDMREKNRRSEMMSDDQILPSYQAELIQLNTVVEWNKYKNENFTRVDNYGRSGWSFVSPIDWDWDEEGTIEFLKQLLVNGFTVIGDK